MPEQLTIIQLNHRISVMGTSKFTIQHHTERELEKSYSGNGLYQCNSTAFNIWIRNQPKGWTASTYVKAIQLRRNLLPTMGISSNPPRPASVEEDVTKQKRFAILCKDVISYMKSRLLDTII